MLDASRLERRAEEAQRRLVARGGYSSARRRRETSYTEEEDPEDPDDRYWCIAKYAPRAISAEMAFLHKERAALLAQELALVLPERQRQVLTLLSLGWSYERIARELGIAVGTVKTHVLRARNNPDVAKILLP